MTEDEAKTKWCPFVRVYSVADGEHPSAPNGSWNRHQADGLSETRCIGSACMAWRWRETRGRVKETGEAAPFDGYCGLAERGR